MKLKHSIFSNSITFLLTILILIGSYKLLTYAGQNITAANNNFIPVEIDEAQKSNPYIFYSDAQDTIELYPWNLYYDTVKLSDETDNYDYIIDYKFLISEMIYYYFERMISPATLDHLYNSANHFDFFKEIDLYSIENYIEVKHTYDGNIFFYSKDILLGTSSYLLRFAFTDKYQILSFELSPNISPDTLTDSIDSGKDFLSEYIKDQKNNCLPIILDDIINKNNLCSTYSIKKLELTEIYDIPSSETEDYELKLSEEISYLFPKETSYQIINAENKLLIVMLDNNVILHYDPINNIICGFNVS